MGDRLPLELLVPLTEAEAVVVREGEVVLEVEELAVGKAGMEAKEVGVVALEGETVVLAEVVGVEDTLVQMVGVSVTLRDWVRVGEEKAD